MDFDPSVQSRWLVGLAATFFTALTLVPPVGRLFGFTLVLVWVGLLLVAIPISIFSILAKERMRRYAWLALACLAACFFYVVGRGLYEGRKKQVGVVSTEYLSASPNHKQQQ
jgi:hypothetical protein